MAAVIPSVCAYDSDCRVVVDYVGVGVCSSGVVREALSSWLGPLCLSRVLTFFLVLAHVLSKCLTSRWMFPSVSLFSFSFFSPAKCNCADYG